MKKYQYHDNDMKRKKLSKIRQLRKAQDPPLTLKELARKAGVSYTTVWNLENGPEEKVHPDIKHKVAQALGADAMDLYPSEEARWNKLVLRFEELRSQAADSGITRREAWRLMKRDGIPIGYHHRFHTLMDICPSLNFECELDADEILRQMSPRELRALYHSSSKPREVIKRLNQLAKRLGLNAVGLKKIKEEDKDNVT
jgi:DNA-binding XRE family transcriptional regulator